MRRRTIWRRAWKWIARRLRKPPPLPPLEVYRYSVVNEKGEPIQQSDTPGDPAAEPTVKVSWDAVPGATGYDLYVDDQPPISFDADGNRMNR